MWSLISLTSWCPKGTCPNKEMILAPHHNNSNNNNDHTTTTMFSDWFPPLSHSLSPFRLHFSSSSSPWWWSSLYDFHTAHPYSQNMHPNGPMYQQKTLLAMILQCKSPFLVHCLSSSCIHTDCRRRCLLRHQSEREPSCFHSLTHSLPCLTDWQ